MTVKCNIFLSKLKKICTHPKVQSALLGGVFVLILAVFAWLPAPEKGKETVPEFVLQDNADTIIHEGVKEAKKKPKLFPVPLYEEEHPYDIPSDVEEKKKSKIVIIEEKSLSQQQDEEEGVLKENYDLIPPIADRDKIKIAIVIDDLGMSFERLRSLIKIGKTLNLAFLPYAPNLKNQTQEALAQGHHLLVHMPMQPKSRSIDTGPIVLQPEMSNSVLLQNLKKGLSSFDGYKGVNNHMGSAFTEDVSGMRLTLSYLKSQGLYFLDSKTTATSVGRRVAQDVGIPFVERDVFLDHVNELSVIQDRLAETEAKARAKGYAVAIGHPYKATIQALSSWAKELDKKGIELVALDTLVEKVSSKK